MSFLGKVWGGIKKIAKPIAAVGGLAVATMANPVSAIGSIGSAIGGLLGKIDNVQRTANDAVGGLAVAVQEGRHEAQAPSPFSPRAQVAGQASQFAATGAMSGTLKTVLVLGAGALAYSLFSRR